MISHSQFKAARALLDWSQGKLSDASGVSLPTIQRVERHGVNNVRHSTVTSIQQAFERQGIVFLQNGGVMLDTPDGTASLNFQPTEKSE